MRNDTRIERLVQKINSVEACFTSKPSQSVSCRSHTGSPRSEDVAGLYSSLLLFPPACIAHLLICSDNNYTEVSFLPRVSAPQEAAVLVHSTSKEQQKVYDISITQACLSFQDVLNKDTQTENGSAHGPVLATIKRRFIATN